MLELCEYQLEDREIPQWVNDGGQWLHGDTLIGICNGAPATVERISRWELRDRLVAMHNENNFTDDDDVAFTEAEVRTMADDYFTAAIGADTWEHAKSHRAKLLAAADARIMRWDEQTELLLTPDDNGTTYTAFSTTGYSNKDALLWYKQDLRDITTNYATPDLIVWPTLPT